MTSTTIGFVDFTGKLEPEALAGAIARDAHARLGDVVTLTADWLEEDGFPLNQRQKAALTSNASRLFDGFERDVLAVLLAEVRPDAAVEGASVDA